MYIERIIVKNVRGIRELDFTMPNKDGSFAGWHVITGDNGSGKTALLKAVAIALTPMRYISALEESFAGWMRWGERSAEFGVLLQRGEADTFDRGQPPKRPVWAGRSLTEMRDLGTHDVLPEPYLDGAKRNRTVLATHGPWAQGTRGWFCLGYGPFRRLAGESAQGQKVMSGPAPIARFATLFREDATLGEARSWLEDLAGTGQSDGDAAVLHAVLSLVNDEFLHRGFEVAAEQGRIVLRDTAKVRLAWSDLSDGYRAALAVLLDITRHIARETGTLAVERSHEGHVQVCQEGVVLVDEADAHLHPEWQRQLGFWLTKRLPGIQFIVTTHSPFICQAADELGVFHLPPVGSDRAPFQLSQEQYRTVVSSAADHVYWSEAFDMADTRSPRAIAKEVRHAALESRRRAGLLTPDEKREMDELGHWLQSPTRRVEPTPKPESEDEDEWG